MKRYTRLAVLLFIGERVQQPELAAAGCFFPRHDFWCETRRPPTIGAVPLAMLYAHAVFQKSRPWRLASSLILILVVFGTFWHLRTFVLTGNPVYPFQLAAAVSRQLEPVGAHTVNRPSYFTIPWLVHFEGREARGFESPSETPMGIFLVLFLFGWFELPRRGRPGIRRACWFFISIYFLYWGSIGPLLRYAVGPILLLFVFTTERLMLSYRKGKAGSHNTLCGL